MRKGLYVRVTGQTWESWGWTLLAIFLVGCGADARSVSTPSTAPTAPALQAAPYEPAFPEAVAAVRGFLDAEVATDFEKSFAYLSEVDQSEAGGVEGWMANHYFVLPVLTGYQINGEEQTDDNVGVKVLLSLEPDIDVIAGLTPSRAESIWVVRQADARIALTESTLTPIYPKDDTATADVEAWAVARQSCQPGQEWDAGLLGFPGVADGLCGARGPVRVGEPAALEDAAESAPFLAAFGPEVGIWARVVTVESPIELRVVVAPLGERWLVIGVLEG